MMENNWIGKIEFLTDNLDYCQVLLLGVVLTLTVTIVVNKVMINLVEIKK